MKRILFATDGSNCSEKASEKTRELLCAFPDARLTILYVTDTVRGMPSTVIPDATFTKMEQEAKVIEETTMSWFQPYLERLEFQHGQGLPERVICETANATEADLIVVGSHGRNMAGRIFVGSVSRGVLNMSKIPVLVVRA